MEHYKFNGNYDYYFCIIILSMITDRKLHSLCGQMKL
jgi:hypothetical protein